MSVPASGSRRWTLWGAVGCAAGLIAALWIGPRLIDWSSFKPEIAAFMSQQLGVDVALRGPLKIEILPQPRVTAADIRITGTTANGHIRWLRGSLDPRGLLTGSLRPRNIELVEADLTLPFVPTDAPRYSTQTVVDIQDGRLTLTGGPDWLPDIVEHVDGRLALGSGTGRLFAFDGEARLSDEPVGISVEGDGKGRLVLAIAHGPSASDFALEGGPTEAGGWAGNVTLVLEEAGFLSTLRAEAVTRLIGDGPATVDATVEVSPSGIVTLGAERIGTTRLNGQASATIVPGSRSAFDVSVRINRADFSDSPPAPVWIAEDLAAALRRFSGVDITARISADRVEIPTGTIRQTQIAVAAGGGILVVENASAILPGEADVSLFGSLRPADGGWTVDGEFAMVGSDARTALTALYPPAAERIAALPADRLRSVDLSARVYADGESVEITELYGRIDETAWAGAVSARADTGIDILLQGDRLNLDRLGTVPSDLPGIGLGLLNALPNTPRGVTHRLALSLDQATVAGIRADGAALEMKYEPGSRLSGDVRAVSVASAAVRGRFDLNLGGEAGQGDLSLSLETPTPDRFLGALGLPARQAARAAAFGTTTVTLDVSGSPAGGFGYAVEALGSRGDARISGVYEPGPVPAFEVTKGALNLGDLSVYHVAAHCAEDGPDTWLCRDVEAEMAGLRVAGSIQLSAGETGRQLDLSIAAMEVDIGLFASQSGLPVLPEGQARLAGNLSGKGGTLFAAAGGLQGDLTLNGEVALAIRRGGGGRFGNVDTLRTKLREHFGKAVPLDGQVRMTPDRLQADVTLSGRGADLNGTVTIGRADTMLNADLTIRGSDGAGPYLELTADGPANAPGVKLKGPWITGR